MKNSKASFTITNSVTVNADFLEGLNFAIAHLMRGNGVKSLRSEEERLRSQLEAEQVALDDKKIILSVRAHNCMVAGNYPITLEGLKAAVADSPSNFGKKSITELREVLEEFIGKDEVGDLISPMDLSVRTWNILKTSGIPEEDEAVRQFLATKPQISETAREELLDAVS
jgi:DNA-directed RNA polymerase alpha subunit